jgi:hypothetical protein
MGAAAVTRTTRAAPDTSTTSLAVDNLDVERMVRGCLIVKMLDVER